MGKAGEKQKKKPKLTDKKQSERFKQTAREIGADQETEDASRVLDQMLGTNRSAAPTGNETTLVGINSGAIASLADGTLWRLAPDGERARTWANARVMVVHREGNQAWRFAIVNLDTKDWVGALPSSRV